jgi:hypothetical protein
MTLRRNFGSSKLVRMLSDWAPPDTTAPRMDVAERLGAWLGVSDAISLHAAHQSMKSAPPAKLPDVRLPGVLDVEAEFLRVRAALVLAIQTSDSSAARARRLRSPTGQPGTDAETDVSFAPYRKRYLDLQRHMELRVAALRAHVRRGIGIASPELSQLAKLDAAMEQVLGAREQQLLSTVPLFLARRFEELRKNHVAAGSGDPVSAIDPNFRQQPPAWQRVFGNELQAVLLAELDDRLQPVAGMVDALNKLLKKTQ